MPNQAMMDASWQEAQKIFWERNKKYGTAGMSISKATSLASTKLDRLVNDNNDHDSAIDLLNYSLIILLQQGGGWSDESEASNVRMIIGAIQAQTLKDGHVGIMTPKRTGDVGYDLVVSEDTLVPAWGSPPVNVPFDVAIKLPEGYWAEIRPRSSTPLKHGVQIHQSVMDTGYTGPWFGICNSLSSSPVLIKAGTRLAQCIIHKAETPKLEWVNELPNTERGTQGFGSTG